MKTITIKVEVDYEIDVDDNFDMTQPDDILYEEFTDKLVEYLNANNIMITNEFWENLTWKINK